MAVSGVTVGKHSMHVSRRQILASAAALALPIATEGSPHLKVLVSGGHPGDPECGCAGTIARYVALGHEVVLLYLNRGEGYCHGFDLSQCGTIRTEEAKKACAILHARPVFAGQIDGQAVVDDAHYEALARIVDSESPDLMFLQWPVDRHRDHRALSMLMLDAWLRGGKRAALYYYEVADDTMMFSPSEFVDISAPEVESRRRAACFAHASQQPEKWYAAQTKLTQFRGSQSGHTQAEGFVRHWESTRAALP